jgi:hypothetical protein
LALALALLLQACPMLLEDFEFVEGDAGCTGGTDVGGTAGTRDGRAGSERGGAGRAPADGIGADAGERATGGTAAGRTGDGRAAADPHGSAGQGGIAARPGRAAGRAGQGGVAGRAGQGGITGKAGQGGITGRAGLGGVAGSAGQGGVDTGGAGGGTGGVTGAGPPADCDALLYLTPHNDDIPIPMMHLGFIRQPAVAPDNEQAPRAAAMPVGTQTHVAVVVDSSGNTLAPYVGGELATSAPFTDELANLNDINNGLGRSQFSQEAGAHFDGCILEFRIYSVALTGSQLQTSFSEGPDPAFLEELG